METPMVYQVDTRPCNPLVSVVVVNYNAGVLLSKSVMDVLASTVPVEVFVVDNGSSDDSIY